MLYRRFLIYRHSSGKLAVAVERTSDVMICHAEFVWREELTIGDEIYVILDRAMVAECGDDARGVVLRRHRVCKADEHLEEGRCAIWIVCVVNVSPEGVVGRQDDEVGAVATIA